jgi:aryl-alcohol dehydrogenase-like predicted oxidoreductase
MKYRRLGRTGLAVSPLCLGTMGFGPPMDLADADRLVRSALDLGVNFIDTANCYDGPQRGAVVHGHAESMLGQILGDNLRDEFVLVSKVGVPLRDGPQHRGLSATHLLRELENSLRRLRTDYLDVFMIHWPDAFACPEEVLRAVQVATAAGKVRHFGISNHAAWQVCEYLWIADLRGWAPPCVSELPLSIFDRRYENDLPFYPRHEIAVLAYQPLLGGRLSERRLGDPAGPPTVPAPVVSPQAPPDETETLQKLAGVATANGMSLSTMAIAWAASAPGVASVILGSRTVERLEAGLRAAQTTLSPEILAAVDAICPGPPRPVPRFAR